MPESSAAKLHEIEVVMTWQIEDDKDVHAECSCGWRSKDVRANAHAARLGREHVEAVVSAGEERSAANVDEFASHYEALGYTLGTGKLWAPISVFHAWAERLLGRPILTHEFADPETWVELRAVFEEGAAIRAEGGDDIEF